MQRESGGAPEHIRSILTRLLSDLEREMTQDFNPKLSSKIDEVVFLIDFLNSMGKEKKRNLNLRRRNQNERRE